MNSAAARGLDAELGTRLVEQISDYAIIALDAQGVITSWNAGAGALKGYSAEEILGNHFSIFYSPEDRRVGLPMRLLEEARVLGRVEHTGWRYRKDRTAFWADSILTAIRDEDGEIIGYAKVTRDLTEQHALQERLRESETRFRHLVSQVRDYAIIGLDLQGVITSWNSGAQLLKGYTAEEAIGRHFSIFYEQADRTAGVPQSLLAQARRHGSTESTGWRVRKDGRRFWGDVVISAIRNEDGDLTGYAKVTRDLTAQKQFEDSRNDFYAALSHDLRTPLTAIQGFADLLPTATVEEQAALIGRIQANVVRVNNLADYMIHNASLVSGKQSLEYSACDLREVVANCVTDLGSLTIDHAIELHAHSVSVEIDCNAVARIVNNLIVNAIRYSRKGSTITIEVLAADGAAVIKVGDQGRGIHPDDLGLITQRSYRGRLANPDDGGAGVGLASVATLVELHQGSMDIESTLGKGTTVTVRFPLSSEQSARDVSSATPSAKNEEPTVL